MLLQLLYYLIILLLIPIILIILLIIAIIRSIFIYFNIPLNHHKTPYNLSPETYTYFRNKLLPDHKLIDYNYYDPFTKQDYSAKIVTITTPLKIKKSLVIIHGICGTAYSWSYAIPELRNTFSDIYLLNLPGNELSDGAKDFLSTASLQEVKIYYANFIKSTFENFNIKDCTLLSHSLGCIYTIEFLKNNYQLVNHVVFLACPPLHSHMNKLTPIVKLLFINSFPQSILRILKLLGVYALYHLFDILQLNDLQYYNLLKWNRGWEDTLFSRHMNNYLSELKTDKSSLHDSIQLPIKIYFIHGQNDSILTLPTLNFIKRVYPDNLFHVISNMGHCCYNTTTSTNVAKILTLLH